VFIHHQGLVVCSVALHDTKDTDLFLWFLITKLLRLAAGVKAFDGMQQFILHAYLLLCTGDMPAVAMIMQMFGHTAMLSCRMCSIVGVLNPANPCATTHYPALNRHQHPGCPLPAKYDPQSFPTQTHDGFLAQAQEIKVAAGSGEWKQLSKAYGIKGLPVLSLLPSISFPASFPFGLMHLFIENVIPNLVNIWSHALNPSLPDDNNFIIAPGVWKAIAEAGATSGKTIPLSFGSPVPNILTEHSLFTAETWMFWTIFLAPTLL
jgi:hypothetical protein